MSDTSKQKKGSVTAANFIALAGLAGIGVITFFGQLFKSQDGAPGGAIITAVALVAALTFLLVFSIKAKSAKDNLDKWIYAEIACVVVYVAVALLFASPFQRFFYVMTEKENLKAMAVKEVEAIDSLYSKYERQQENFMQNAVEQIRNYYDSSKRDNELSSTLSDAGIKNKKEIASWEKKASKIMELPKDKQLAEIKSRIEVWNLMSLTALAAELEQKGKSAWTDVKNHIRNAVENHKLIPVIGGTMNNYFFDGYAEFDLGSAPEPKFAETLRSSNGNTATGWIVYVVLNLMVLFNYLVTNRSRHVGPSKHKTLGTEL